MLKNHPVLFVSQAARIVLLLLLLVLVPLVVIISTPAIAAASTGEAVATQAAIAFTVDPALVIQLVLTILLPIVVGLVTTRVTSPAVKAWLLAGLTLLTSLLVELGSAISGGTTFDLGTALMLAIPAFAISVATHYGLWKPVGVADKAQAFGSP